MSRCEANCVFIPELQFFRSRRVSGTKPVPKRLEYRIVDVFTDTPFLGNPLAVFLDARGVTNAAMQNIAREMNLSETVFLLPSDDGTSIARARIFTPAKELPFAGHPTIGTAYVLATENVVLAKTARFCLQEIVGAVPIRLETATTFMAWLTTPPIVFGEECDARDCAAALGLSDYELLPGVIPQVVSAGVPGVFIALRDRAAVDRAVLDERKMVDVLRSPGVLERFVFCPTDDGAYSRMFVPGMGIPEDPATGGLTGPLAAYMMKNGLVSHASGTRFVSEQGVKMGRRSLLHVIVNGERGADGIEVGGTAAIVAEGTLLLPDT